MIVPMRKLNLLLFHKEKEEFLSSLQELGVVHVVVNQHLESESLTGMQDKMKAAERVLKALKRIASEKKLPAAQEKEDNAEEIVAGYDALVSEQEKLEQQIIKLTTDAQLLKPWGDFDPASVKRLRNSGVFMRFFILPEKKFNSLDIDSLNVEIINRGEDNVYFVVFDHAESALKELEEVILPQASLKQALESIKELNLKQSEIHSKIEEFIRYQDILTAYISKINSSFSMESARLSMEESAGGKVCSLTGWLPVRNAKKVSDFLDKFSAWYEITLPTPSDDVPVQLSNNAYARLFEPITKIFSLPDYFEFDPTPMFAPFFMFFVGMCLGDLAYGTILFLIGFIAYFIGKKSARAIFWLLMVIGASVAVNGVLLNSFFGRTLFGGPGIPEGTALISNGAQYFSPLSPVITDKGTVFPAMAFAMVLGFIQLNFGMLLNAITRIRMYGITFGLAPIGNVLMVNGGLIWATHANFLNLNLGTVTIGPVTLGSAILSVPLIIGQVFLFSGLGLFFLFNNPELKLIQRIFAKGPLEFYFFVSGFIGNILSYLRLFALGLAGGLLGNAFNYIAFMLVTKDGVVNYATPMFAGTILILILGHSINLGLSMIGSFVHPLRLTFVEFYGSFSFKGGGKQYRPFTVSNTE